MIGSETYRFDDSGRLVRITDEYGNHRDITYTAGRITSVTDGAGRDFGFSYDAAGYLTAITAPDNTSVCYGYTNDTPVQRPLSGRKDGGDCQRLL